LWHENGFQNYIDIFGHSVAGNFDNEGHIAVLRWGKHHAGLIVNACN
jgi:hypothetical protein